jgi:hypothetical protein
MHVHLDDHETAHHHGQSLHAHLQGHETVVPPGRGPVADHQEDAGRTVKAQIYVSAAGEPFSLAAIPFATHVLVVPPAQPGGRTPHVAHAHDPPSATVRSPRAPPACLS